MLVLRPEQRRLVQGGPSSSSSSSNPQPEPEPPPADPMLAATVADGWTGAAAAREGTSPAVAGVTIPPGAPFKCIYHGYRAPTAVETAVNAAGGASAVSESTDIEAGPPSTAYAGNAAGASTTWGRFIFEEYDIDAWVDRELLAALKLRAQIYRGRGPLKSVGEIVEEKIETARNERLGQQRPKRIVEEKIEAARNWRLGQEAAWSTVGEIVEEKTEAARNGLPMYTAPNKSTRRRGRRQEAAKRKMLRFQYLRRASSLVLRQFLKSSPSGNG